MPNFADMRATLRHGDIYFRSKAILSVALIVADADNRGDEEASDLIDVASRMPGLSNLTPGTLRAAIRDIRARLHDDGAEQVFEDAAACLDEKGGISAVLLAMEVSMASGSQSLAETAVLAAMAKRLRIDDARQRALARMAAHRMRQGKSDH